MTSPQGSTSALACVCVNGTYKGNGGYCIACDAGYSCSGGKKTICPANTYSNSGASSCTSCGSGKMSPAGSTYYKTADAAMIGGNIKCGRENFTLGKPATNCYTITCIEDCDCGDDNDCSDEFSACWKCGNKYNYGTNTQYASTCTQVASSYCSSNSPAGSSSKPATGSSNKPTGSSSKPATGSSNKPASSNSLNKPSSSTGNVDKNPQTGEITIFIVWIVAFLAIAYSIYSFKKVKNN